MNLDALSTIALATFAFVQGLLRAVPGSRCGAPNSWWLGEHFVGWSYAGSLNTLPAHWLCNVRLHGTPISMQHPLKGSLDLAADVACASPILRPGEVIDVGMMAGPATRDASRRWGEHGDPTSIGNATRPTVRGACAAPPAGRTDAFESAVWRI